jgi:Flp pilus assembly protein CpaB
MPPTSRSTKQFFSTAARQWRELVHRIISAVERQRRIQIVVALAASLVCASVVAESVATARLQRKKWSSNVSVVVITKDVATNERLTSDNTKLATLPEALVPADAVTSLPAQATTRVALATNTPLSQSLLVPTAESVDIPTGWRIIALPPDIIAPLLTPGDTVDVISGNTVLASDSVVVSLEPLTLALPAETLPEITMATRVGDVFIAAQR